jgi:hypothetical protein
VKDAHLYRDGDVHRLVRAVEQLDRRLPMQTTYVQMPFENTLGGFEFFNTGVPDLAPELKGFYGEPGIAVDSKPETTSTIFLVGDHFSVHETKVIAGNLPLVLELMSRQVMRITVPGTARMIEAENGKVVDVHVATPYGISNHLLVPAVVPPKPEPPPPEGIGTPALPLKYTLLTKEAKGCLCFDGACGNSTKLHCLDNIEVAIEANCPCACPEKVGFAAFIQLKKADGTPILANAVATQAICLDSNQFKRLCDGEPATLFLNARQNQQLADAISQVLGQEGVCKTDAPATIEVKGCLRVQNRCEECRNGTCQPGADYEYDLVKLPPITIKVTECLSPTSSCPKSPPPAASANPAPEIELVPKPAPPAEPAPPPAPSQGSLYLPAPRR